jgi:hypothetical protein
LCPVIDQTKKTEKQSLSQGVEEALATGNKMLYRGDSKSQINTVFVDHSDALTERCVEF